MPSPTATQSTTPRPTLSPADLAAHRAASYVRRAPAPKPSPAPRVAVSR